MLCSALNLVAFALSFVFVKDPLLVLERSLVRIEKAVDFSYRGISLAAHFIVQTMGFTYAFFTTSVIFFLAYIAFKIF